MFKKDAAHFSTLDRPSNTVNLSTGAGVAATASRQPGHTSSCFEVASFSGLRQHDLPEVEAEPEPGLNLGRSAGSLSPPEAEKWAEPAFLAGSLRFEDVFASCWERTEQQRWLLSHQGKVREYVVISCLRCRRRTKGVRANSLPVLFQGETRPSRSLPMSARKKRASPAPVRGTRAALDAAPDGLVKKALPGTGRASQLNLLAVPRWMPWQDSHQRDGGQPFTTIDIVGYSGGRWRFLLRVIESEPSIPIVAALGMRGGQINNRSSLCQVAEPGLCSERRTTLLFER